MHEAFEGSSGTLRVGKPSWRSVGLQKFAQRLTRSLSEAEFSQPSTVVGEVDVSSDVLAAWIGIDVGSRESLVQ